MEFFYMISVNIQLLNNKSRVADSRAVQSFALRARLYRNTFRLVFSFLFSFIPPPFPCHCIFIVIARSTLDKDMTRDNARGRGGEADEPRESDGFKLEQRVNTRGCRISYINF